MALSDLGLGHARDYHGSEPMSILNVVILEAYMKRSEFQSRTRLGFVLILAVALLTALAQSGFAQEATAAITGKISDPSGAAVVGATVTAKDADRGTVWQRRPVFRQQSINRLPWI